MSVYEGHGVTLHHADCLDVLRTLPDASVDSVVTDPPYGLEFMGKEWDSFKTYAGGNPNMKPQGATVGDSSAVTHGLRRKNPRCRRCGKLLRGNGSCKCPEPQPDTRTAEGANQFQFWCEAWATECLRVLKPGGHLLAFGGTRTWHRLACAVEDAGFEVRDSIAWLYGSGFPKSLDVSKAIDKAAGAEREVTGRTVTPFRVDNAATRGTSLQGSVNGDFSRQSEDGYRYTEHTAPATPDAERWQGWGTALKPSHEPVCVARKPLRDSDILDTIGSHLDALEAQWQAPEADPTTPTGAAGGSHAQTDMSPSGSTALTSSSTVSSWRACWVELCELTSTSTTETTSSTTTALKTLSSSLSSLTHESTHPSATSPHGSTSLASAVDNLFASVVCGLRATLALSATEPATGRTPRSPLAAVEGSPAFEPVVVARKPLTGTVAANVLAHGTGALNIDGCRVTGATGLQRPERRGKGETGGWANYEQAPGQYGTPDGLGRWPANVVLDETQAEALDEQSGDRPGDNPNRKPRQNTAEAHNRTVSMGRATEDWTTTGHADIGGASRFFYVAKADASERPRVNGTAHPTVKPLDLMRWLVRLVTPPGGTVLEPFAGSGTTVEACIIEGFQCIAIEREADYLPLIRQRIDRRRDPVEALRGQAADLGLFDLLGGEGA